ncbi:hypothetical protein EMIT0158MI4_70055 [Burkholderia ambifaria]
MLRTAHAARHAPHATRHTPSAPAPAPAPAPAGRPGIRVAANPVTARYFSPLFPPNSIASESGPNTTNTQALQRMQASWHRPRKRYRVSRPEMI